jgi:hypothetical protein
LFSALAALAHDRHALARPLVPDPLGREQLAHFQLIAVRHRQAVVPLEQSRDRRYWAAGKVLKGKFAL